MRAGLHWSGAGGSGVIVARLPNGQWSPPSGILIHTLGWGLLAGADVYDCVCVINNDKGMEGFTRVRCTLGGEISAAVGPLGAGSTLDTEVIKRQAPVWTYTKSKGLYLGFQIDGTIIVERTGENERFYGVEKIRNKQILAGEVTAPSGTTVQLWETLQAIEGKAYDETKLPEANKAPGDFEVEKPRATSQKEYDDLGGTPELERMDTKSGQVSGQTTTGIDGSTVLN
jgi:lipid-binding SYLF domain-containing protein